MIEIEGQIFTPDYRSKEKRLYQIIASRENEIKSLNEEIYKLNNTISLLSGEIVTLRERKKRKPIRKRRTKSVSDTPDVRHQEATPD